MDDQGARRATPKTVKDVLVDASKDEHVRTMPHRARRAFYSEIRRGATRERAMAEAIKAMTRRG